MFLGTTVWDGTAGCCDAARGWGEIRSLRSILNSPSGWCVTSGACFGRNRGNSPQSWPPNDVARAAAARVLSRSRLQLSDLEAIICLKPPPHKFGLGDDLRRKATSALEA